MLLLSLSLQGQQKSIDVIKKELQASPNPPLYVKQVLKRSFVLDTIAIARLSSFRNILDSIAYHGKIKQVYGPYQDGTVLLQVLAKLPNTFNHIGQIFLDTEIFTPHMADSLSNDILRRIKTGSASFEDMAMTWSMGGESVSKGDLGWIAAGALVPEMEKAINAHKKGDIFKVRTKQGVHIVYKMDNPKKDNGFALLLRVKL
jgi:hypothetical protein